MQSDNLTRFTNTSEKILEKKAPLWTETCKKQLSIVPGCLIDTRKEKTEATRSAYKRQINFCEELLSKTIKEFYNNLNVKYITKNNFLWKTVKPSFTDQTLKNERITLVWNNKVVSNESNIVEIFSK